MRQLPHRQFRAGVLHHGARINLLLRIRQRKRIQVQLCRQAHQQRDYAQPAQRRRGQLGQRIQTERMLRSSDGNNGEKKDHVVCHAQHSFARGADLAEDGARRKARGDNADGRHLKQREQKNQVALEAARGGKHRQQTDRARCGRDRDQRPQPHEKAAHAAARRSVFAKQLDEIHEGLHKRRTDAPLHECDGLALDPQDEPRRRNGKQQAGKDEQPRQSGEQVHCSASSGRAAIATAVTAGFIPRSARISAALATP